MSYLTEELGKQAFIVPLLIPFIEQISTSLNHESEDDQLLIAYILMSFFCTKRN